MMSVLISLCVIKPIHVLFPIKIEENDITQICRENLLIQSNITCADDDLSICEYSQF